MGSSAPAGLNRDEDGSRFHSTKRGNFHEVFNLSESERPLAGSDTDRNPVQRAVAFINKLLCNIISCHRLWAEGQINLLLESPQDSPSELSAGSFVTFCDGMNLRGASGCVGQAGVVMCLKNKTKPTLPFSKALYMPWDFFCWSYLLKTSPRASLVVSTSLLFYGMKNVSWEVLYLDFLYEM